MENSNSIQQNQNMEWPGNAGTQKSKKRTKFLYLLLAVFLVIGSAFGSFYFSQNLNQASVPNAPESEPQAAVKKQETNNTRAEGCKQGCMSDEYCENERCRKIGGKADGRSDAEKARDSVVTATPTKAGAAYICTPENCPSPCFSCNASKTSCISNGCAGVSAVGIPGVSIAGAPTTAPTNSEGVINHCGSGCDPENCHCLGGDACTGYECRPDLRTSCSRQGRSWCVNMHGEGMTCCEAGYTCRSNGGCVGSGNRSPETNTPPEITTTTTIPPTTTTTITPSITTTVTITPTGTITVTPTPVSCNESCTEDSDCVSGLYCDSASNKCRKSECSTETSCVCPTGTPEPTIVGCNKGCESDSNCMEGLVCDSNSGRCRRPSCMSSSDCRCQREITTTRRPTERETIAATRRPTTRQQETLTEAGILDLPGAITFGGGLILAIVGILLAL